MYNVQKSSSKIKIKIIQEATKKFAKNGFAETSMDDIVKTAGVSKGSLFYHFHSKEELFFAVMSQTRDTALKKISEMPKKKEFATLFQKKENLLKDLGKYYDAIAVSPFEWEKLWFEGMKEAMHNTKLKKLLTTQDQETEKIGFELLKNAQNSVGILEGYSESDLKELVPAFSALHKGGIVERVTGKDPKIIRKGWVRAVYTMYVSKKK